MIAVLASGEGTSLQALLDAGLPVTAVVCDRRCGAYDRGLASLFTHGVREVRTSPFADERDYLKLADGLDALEIGLVVCAGYMRLLPPAFLGRFPGRVINLHPAREFPGAHALRDAVLAGASEVTVVVHHVDEGVDTGEVIAAEVVAVPPGITEGELRELVRPVEHALLARVVAEMLPGVVR